MKNLLLLLLLLGTSLAANSQTAPTWTQVWSDEFSGTTLDQTKWTYETGTGVNGDFGTGQLDRATDRPENVAIEQGIAGATGGALRISTRKETYLDRNYTSGRINTKDKAFWGPNHRIVARVWPKGVRTKGQGFAFWMMGNEHPTGVQELTWPQLGEIDIMEYVGSIPDHNLGTVHYAWYYNNNQYQDGNHGQHGAYYSFATKQTPDREEWIRLDLKAIYSINRVNLSWENKNSKNYNIETSLDGTSWAPVFSTTTGDGGIDDVTFAATNARFVRVRGTGRSDDYGYSLFEFQVYGAGSATNLALASEASASSSQASDLLPRNAIDGQTSTRWGSAPRNPEYQTGTVASTTDPNIGANGWHEYGIDWFSDRMEFFVDGSVYHIHYFNDGAVSGKVDGENEEALAVVNGKKLKKSEYSNLYPEWHPFEHKMYAILSAGVGGSGNTYGGSVTGEPAVFPADVYIDWVRVYSNGLTFNPPPTVKLTGPTGADTYPAPGSVTLTAEASDTEGGTISSVSFYNGTALIGTDNAAPFSYNWTNVPAGNYVITAKATDNGGITSTSNAVKVAVNGPTSNLALNRPGTASSTLGDQGASRAFDADLGSKWESVHANATDWIYVDLGNTYEVNRVKILWESAFAKDYDIKFSADKTNWTPIKSITGNTTTTNDITGLSGKARYVGIFCLTKQLPAYGYSIYNVEVYGSGGTTANAAPAVSITAPAANASFTAPATVNMTANASDTDGTVSKVEFYQGAILLGTDASAPYSFSWTNVAAGTYSITAKATDNGGLTTTSAAVAVTVGTTPPSSTGDLARGKPATASSTRNGNVAGFAVDGDPANTRWESAITGTAAVDDNQWLYVDLGATYNINEVKITWENALGKDYRVEVSFDATTWTSLREVTGNTARENDLTGLRGSGRYVRVLGLTRGTGYGYSIYQLEVYGFPGAAPTGKTVPGKIEAESYDAMKGIQTEPTADANGGLNVGYIDAGDYLDYKVTSSVNAYYTVQFRVASWINGAQLQLQQPQGLEGIATLATVTLPNTGGGQNWQTVTINNVTLPVGALTLRVRALTGGFNFNWLSFAQQNGQQISARPAAAAAAVAPTSQVMGYPNPVETSFYLHNAAENAPVKIVDMTGRVVLQTTVHNSAVEVNTLRAGTYVLLVESKNGLQRLKLNKK
ncbi:discoidin domain-containing protein [uncultured Hymenobacter sp.]|uniref:discoidin domain-containing protein n=1 Tax=uncultured Hymenobacter sp. TaxID=170016 RepID=UPI0035CAB341